MPETSRIAIDSDCVIPAGNVRFEMPSDHYETQDLSERIAFAFWNTFSEIDPNSELTQFSNVTHNVLVNIFASLQPGDQEVFHDFNRQVLHLLADVARKLNHPI